MHNNSQLYIQFITMSVDFSQDIKTTERQMNTYVRKGQKVPQDVLAHHNNLLSATLNAQQVENGQADDLPSGNLNSLFPLITTTDDIILKLNTSTEYVLIQNIGDKTVYIHFGAPAAIGAGLQLLAGASWSSQIPQFIQNDIHAITVSGTSTLALYYLGD